MASIHEIHIRRATPAIDGIPAPYVAPLRRGLQHHQHVPGCRPATGMACLYPRRTSHAATAGGANSGTFRGSLLSVEKERWSACAWVRSIASRLGRSVGDTGLTYSWKKPAESVVEVRVG